MTDDEDSFDFERDYFTSAKKRQFLKIMGPHEIAMWFRREAGTGSITDPDVIAYVAELLGASSLSWKWKVDEKGRADPQMLCFAAEMLDQVKVKRPGGKDELRKVRASLRITTLQDEGNAKLAAQSESDGTPLRPYTRTAAREDYIAETNKHQEYDAVRRRDERGLKIIFALGRPILDN